MSRKYLLKWCLIVILSAGGAYASMIVGGGLSTYENKKEWGAYRQEVQKKESMTDKEFAEFLEKSNAFATNQDLSILVAKKMRVEKRAAIGVGGIIWLVLGVYCGFRGFGAFLVTFLIMALIATPFVGLAEVLVYFMAFGLGSTLSPWMLRRIKKSS